MALEACIAYVRERGIQTFLFLGDYVGELAYPQETLKLLYELREQCECYFVRGNKEEYQLDYRKSGAMGWKEQDSTTGSLLYDYRNLTTADLDFFAQMPIARKVCLPGLPALTICHGSPLKVNQKLLPEDEATCRIMENSETDWILCGHTHMQKKICHGGKTVLDAGSVGIRMCRSSIGNRQWRNWERFKEENSKIGD